MVQLYNFEPYPEFYDFFFIKYNALYTLYYFNFLKFNIVILLLVLFWINSFSLYDLLNY
jgi:hypothetical protein